MDSRTFLDYAFFQLTPTRTRCDLVIYAGGASEKLASGLLQPFVQHLKTAKDQISRGGYSITLRPQFSNASWFTKATLQRFVRFVSSPEVLERFVMIEREIEQIESSVQSNELLNADAEGNGDKKSTSSYKSTQEQNRDDGTAREENSKVRLQRALGTRKAVLHREQAMAYARALVIGFEMDAINDLISFADAFGALRLRETCINFRELCKKKNQDRLWVDEIAAVQAARLELPGLANSGIILTGEENQTGIFFNGKHNGSIDASISDSGKSHGSDVNQDGNLPADGKVQVPMPWANHLPQYTHNFQGPLFQQMPPYQTYPFPGMQVPPPYFPGNLQWPPNMNESSPWRSEYHSRQRSSSRKKKSSHEKGLENSDEDDVTESSNSDTDSVSDGSSKKSKNQSSKKQSRSKNYGKSSRKVVIRNINYVTSKDEEETSDDEEDLIDGEALKQQVEEAVGSLERRQKSCKHGRKKSHRSGKDGSSDVSDQEQKNSSAINPEKEKVNDQWGAFQTLLMRDTDQESLDTGSCSLQVQDEYFVANISEGKARAFDLELEEVRKQRLISSDSFIATNRETTNGFEPNVKGFEAIGDSHSVIKRRDSTYEDLLFSQRNESGDNVRDAVADYSSESRIIKGQSERDWFVANKDESMDLKMFNGDYVLSSENFNGSKSKNDLFVDDSFMIQARPVMDDHTDTLLRTDIVEATQYESGTVEEVSHKPKGVGEYEPDDLYMVLGRVSAAEHAVSSWMPEISYGNDILSVEANGKHLIIAEDQLPSSGKSNSKDANGKLGKKVLSKDARLKVLNGALTKSRTEIMSRTKKPSPGGRTMAHKGKSDPEEERRRRMEELLLQRQKRIAERSNGGGNPAMSRKVTVEKRPGLTSTKNDKPKALSTNQELKKTVFRTSTIDRLATARTTAKEPPAQSKLAQTKKPALKANGASQKTASTDKRTGLNTVKTDDNKQNSDMKTISKEPEDVSATEVTKPKDTSDGFKDIKELHSLESLEKTEVKKIQNVDALDEKSCNDDSVQIDSSKHIEISNRNGQDLSKTLDHPVKDISVNMAHPRPDSQPKAAIFVNQYVEADGKTHQNFKPRQETLEIETSTPPPTDETNPELVHARKKWNTDESSPKATKGFRKLLLFGRKS